MVRPVRGEESLSVWCGRHRWKRWHSIQSERPTPEGVLRTTGRTHHMATVQPIRRRVIKETTPSRRANDVKQKRCLGGNPRISLFISFSNIFTFINSYFTLLLFQDMDNSRIENHFSPETQILQPKRKRSTPVQLGTGRTHWVRPALKSQKNEILPSHKVDCGLHPMGTGRTQPPEAEIKPSRRTVRQRVAPIGNDPQPNSSPETRFVFWLIYLFSIFDFSVLFNFSFRFRNLILVKT